MASDEWRDRLSGLLAEYTNKTRSAERASAGESRLDQARSWHAELVDHGLAAPGWPASVGGLDLQLEDQLDYYRMVTAAGVPSHPCPLSFIVAPTLITHGTKEQKDRYLTPLLRADELWCQGFSEPGAGSDLASLSTRAIRDGDVYRVTGQKVWTTQADRADWMFALVRTGPVGRGTDGITYLLIAMDTPGITVRPLRDISGAAHFAEVFFDDVRVPISNVVGEEGGGWSIMRTSLGHERATAFLADEFRYRRTVDRVFSLVVDQGLDADPLARQEIASIEAGVRSIAANSSRALAAVLRGEDPGGVASVNRLVKSEFEQQLHALALRAVGPAGALGNRAADAIDKGRWTYGYLMSRATTIGAGTAEIQRNTIAESVLGLPSHRGEGTRTAAVPPGTPLAAPDGDEIELRSVLAKSLESAVDQQYLLSADRGVDCWDADIWAGLVEFGLPGLAVDESRGGSGASPRLLAAAIEESGRALAPVPLVATVGALAVLESVGADALVSAVCGGETAAFVVPVSDRGWITEGLDLPTWDGSVLRGVVSLVAGAPAATHLVVLARHGDEQVLVAARAEFALVTAQQPLDPTNTVASVTFDDTPGSEIARGDLLVSGLAEARRTALLAGAADSIGVAGRALALAVAWAGERSQFGRAIGSFQAVSHRLVDNVVALESARSQVSAASELMRNDPDADLLVDLAASAAFDVAVNNTEAAIQVHGGIGFTWEHPCHLLLRRARSNAVLFGAPHALRDRAARAIVADSIATKVKREAYHL